MPWEDIDVDATLISSLQDWLVTQPSMQARVEDAARHFGVEEIRIRQAASDGHWLGVMRFEGVDYVFADGE